MSGFRLALAVVSALIFGANVIMAAALHNWSAVSGWCCALMWVVIATLKDLRADR